MMKADTQDLIEITALAKKGITLSNNGNYEEALEIANECLNRVEQHGIKFPNRIANARMLVEPVLRVKAGLEILVSQSAVN